MPNPLIPKRRSDTDLPKILKTIPLFSNLNEKQIELFKESCQHFSFPKGTIILQQRERSADLFIVLSGSVKISLVDQEGRETILDFLEKGEFFGELSLFDAMPRSATVTAMSNTEILIMARDTFLKTICQYPDVMLGLFSVVVKRFRKADERIETLTFLDVKGRVSKLLIDSALKKGERLSGGFARISRPTHQSLANQVGSSREAVTKALKSLINDGLIAVKGNEITIASKQF